MNKNNSKKKVNFFKVRKRLLKYIIGRHKFLFVTVVACILVSSSVVVLSSLFLQTLIDDYIVPLLVQTNPSFDGLLHKILTMAAIYFVGIIATLVYNKLVIRISQGTLKEIRDDMFLHMQKLPIRYFDTHTHGDIMSHYTNDTDTLRQFISQALPQLISAVVTIVVILSAMFANSVPLTILIIVMTIIMEIVTQKVGGASAKYFIKQQTTLGDVTGYIEEMINGQKVIKVFCHEEKAKEKFNVRNEILCNDSTNANKYGNILMPIIMQIGNLQYILIAIVGGLLALNGVGGLTVGMIVAFLNLSKTYCMPVSQISQQISMMAMALAGAERIFELIDEEVETDDGYVSLVHINYDENINPVETDDPKAIFAWKHPHHDGTLTYVPVKGDIEFRDVDFGYTEKKIVLHNIVLDATASPKPSAAWLFFIPTVHIE